MSASPCCHQDGQISLAGRPARRRRADVDPRHRRATQRVDLTYPHPRAGARGGRTLRVEPRLPPSRLRSGVAVVTLPRHLGGLFRVLQCVSDGRPFSLLERFTVEGWLDAVRRHPTPDRESRARPRSGWSSRRTWIRRTSAAFARWYPDGAALPGRRRRLHGEVRDARAHLLRRHRVRGGVGAGNLTDHHSSGPPSGAASGGPRRMPSSGWSIPVSGTSLAPDHEGILEVKAGDSARTPRGSGPPTSPG